MPYIAKALQTRALKDSIIHLVSSIKDASDMDRNTHLEKPYGSNIYGILEYAVFRMIQELAALQPRFQNLNALIGVLDTTKLEVARRLLGPMEDLKLIENWAEDEPGV